MKWQSYYYNFRYGVQLRKPRLSWRMARNYLRIIAGRQSLLRYVDICVDLKCNLFCKHCFAENFKTDDKRPLTDSEWAEIFDQCHDLGNLAIAFTEQEN